MYKELNKNKKLIISHIADIDGMGSVILAKKYFDNNIDVILTDVNELPELFDNLDSTDYETIYCCDLSLSPSTIEVLNSHNEITSKLKHFDHHIAYEENNKPSYVFAIDTLDGRKTCGTELFYRYLLTQTECQKIDKLFYKELVEATREQDTWDFKEYDKLAKDLASIHGILGSKNYIDFILELDDSENLEIPKQMNNILDAENDVKNIYIDKADENIFITNYLSYKIGVSISEQYRSIVGNDLCIRHPELDFMLIINFQRMSCSLRTTRDDINLSDICKIFEPNGGGHQKAAGFSINENSIDKISEILKDYFSEIKEKRML